MTKETINNKCNQNMMRTQFIWWWLEICIIIIFTTYVPFNINIVAKSINYSSF